MGRVVKGVLVAFAAIFFVGLGVVLWAFQTGRAVEFVRDELLNALALECGVRGSFDSVELGLFPPRIHLRGVAITGGGDRSIAAVEQASLRVAALPFLYGRVQLRELAVLAPQATIEIAGGRVVNLPACIQSSGESARSPTLGIDDLRVERGAFRLLAPGIDARLDDISASVFPGEAGGAEIALGFDDGRVELDGRPIALSRLRLLAHVSGLITEPRAISVHRLELASDLGSLEGSGSLDFLGLVLEARVAARTELAALPPRFPVLPPMAGEVEVRGSVVGSVFAPRMVGELSVTKGQVDHFGLGDRIRLEFRADQHAVDVDRVEIRLHEGLTLGKGRVELDPARRFPTRMELEVNKMSLARVIEALDLKGPWVELASTGKLDVRGHLLGPFAIGGAFDIVAAGFHVFDRAWNRPELYRGREVDPTKVLLALGPTRVFGRWSANEKHILIDEAQIHRGQTRVAAKARFDLDPDGGLNIEGELASFDFADLGPLGGLSLAGVGHVAGRVRGPYADIGGVGSFELKDTAVAGIPFGDGAGSVTWRGSSIDIESIEGRLGRSSYQGAVHVDLSRGARLSIAGSIPRGRVEDLLVPFGVDGADYGRPSGELRASFELAGPVDRLTGPIDVELGELEVVGEKLDRGRVIGRMESGALIAEDFEVHKQRARISGAGYLDPSSGEVRFRAESQGMRLEHIDALRASTDQIGGRLALRATLRGTLRGLTGTVSATLGDVRAGEFGLGGGRVVGRVEGATMKVAGEVVRHLRADGELTLASGLPYRGRLSFDGLDAPRIGGVLTGRPLWRGAVYGRAELFGKLVEWQDSEGLILLERGSMEVGASRFEVPSPAELHLARGVFDTPRLVIAGPTTRLVASGKFGRSLIDLGLVGRVDLAIVAASFPQVERSDGLLSLDASIRGSAAQVDLLGTARIERGLAQWRGLPSRLSGVEAELSFSQSTVLVERAKGRLDGGEVEATGQVLLDGLTPSRILMEIDLAGVRPRFSNPKLELTGTLDGKVFLEGRPDHLVLRGETRATRALVQPKFDWRSIVGDPLARLAPNVYDPSAEVLHLDVLVNLSEPLRLKNDTADVRLSGEVALTGTNQRIGLIGGLTLIEGRANVLGREYRFESGTLDMRDRFRFFPNYDLVLSANACAAQITLNIVGTLDEFATTYASKPEMSDTNIISCLVRGVRIRDLEGLSDTQLQGAAASFAGEALWRLSGVDQQVRKVLPVDQIELTTEYSARERNYEPRVLVAKEIIEGQVRLEFSSSLFNTEDQSISARYVVTPQLTLQTGWNSTKDLPVGDLGLDLRYRWEW